MNAADRQSVKSQSPIASHRSAGLSLLILSIVLTMVACDRDSEPAEWTESQRGSTPASSTQSLENSPENPEKITFISKAIVAIPDPKPTGQLEDDVSCVTSKCHATFATATRIHGPVAMNNCLACHEGDQGAHIYPLKRLGDETCTFCHTVTGTAAHEHQAIANNGCVTCHDPHASNSKFLLTADNVEQLCQRCHNIPWQKHVHQPFASGQCSLCHQPHESNFKSLLRGNDEPEQCFGCHADMKAVMVSSLKVHKPAAEKCSTCHNPHTSEFPFELHATINDTCLSCHKDIAQTVETATVSHDALLIEQGCANCHDPHASQDELLLKARADKLCLSCHDKPLTGHDGHTIPDMRSTLHKTFLHGPVRSGDCTSCHNVHGATHERLLVKTFPKTFYVGFDLKNYALCFTCHNKDLVLKEKTHNLTEFRDGENNLHFVHVNRDKKGRTCKTCHDIHGSDLPNHMATTVPFEGSQWAMPMRFVKTADGGSCSPGCHEPKTYDRLAAAADVLPIPESPVSTQGGQP